MASIDLGMLGVSLSKAAWDATRTNVDITIDNQHPKIKLEYATRFTLGGGCADAPANEIGPNTSKTIQLEADTTKIQFEGVLLYKLISSRSIMSMSSEAAKSISSSIYLVLCWRVIATSGLRVYMNLIEHDDNSVTLGSNAVKKYYHQIFCDKPQKLNGAIRCSWSLGEGTSFTTSMTAGDRRFGKINVEVKDGKSEDSETEPIPVEVSE
jgi:hypothetical protein